MEAMCGEQKAWMDVLVEPEFFDALAEKVVSFNAALIDRMLDAAGGRIDFMRIGDDYGSQQSLTVGPEPWRARVQPGLKRYAAIAKKHGAHYYHHSCGAVRELIPDLLEAGVEVLDPVQVSARGMVPKELHAEFGGRLVFSGGVDENTLLSEGSPEEVRSAVRQLIADMDGLNGGFFIGPTHNFQADCKTENILAMYEEAMKCR
jgi:uroporphyrinogen-III decarboxylase